MNVMKNQFKNAKSQFEHAKIPSENPKTQFDTAKTQFENAKTQKTAQVLAQVFLDRGSKKGPAMAFDEINGYIISKTRKCS